MKDPIKALIGLLALISVALVIFFFLTNNSAEPPGPESPSTVSEETNDPGPQTPKQESGEDPVSANTEKKKATPGFEEADIAIPVPGNPLVVTLLHRPEIGQISIEQYSDKAGGFTGKPLKSGTKVQIPDPTKQGEKIQFIVP